MTTIFSKNSNLKLARQLHLNADHLLYPLAASGCMICSLSFNVTLVSFCHELEHKEHISCMARHLAHQFVHLMPFWHFTTRYINALLIIIICVCVEYWIIILNHLDELSAAVTHLKPYKCPWSRQIVHTMKFVYSLWQNINMNSILYTWGLSYG